MQARHRPADLVAQRFPHGLAEGLFVPGVTYEEFLCELARVRKERRHRRGRAEFPRLLPPLSHYDARALERSQTSRDCGLWEICRVSELLHRRPPAEQRDHDVQTFGIAESGQQVWRPKSHIFIHCINE